MEHNRNSTQGGKKAPIEFIIRALSLCSLGCLFRLARILAFIVARTRNQLTTQTRQNIQLCFAEFNPAQQHKLINNSLVHTCCALLELAALWHKPIDAVLARITHRDIDPQFVDSQKAKIIIAPHHGSWELLNLWLAQQGPLYALYKPARKASLDQYIHARRTRNGATLVPANTAGLRTLLQGLKKHATCMILPDQKPAANMAQTPSLFYGHAADTGLLVKKLASKLDCEIYLAAVTRNLDQANYQLSIQALDREAIVADDETSARYLNQAIESLISQQVCQYQWPYRRFTESVYANSAQTQHPS